MAATGRNAGHFNTNNDCAECHTTTSWANARYTHTSPSYPNHGRTISCTACHASNSEATWTPRTDLKPYCAACHANDYRAGKHKNASVDSLRDCAGACPKPAGEHRVTDRSWD